MKEFYLELVALRKKNKISLEDIHDRTKIDLSHLKSFEKGQFGLIPLTYARLFLRAYVTEIGGNVEESLANFEHYLRKQEGQTDVPPVEIEKKSESKEPSRELLNSHRTPQKMRSDMIKGGILVIVLIFSIYIIRSITSNDTPEPGELYSTYTMEDDGISDIQLTNDFDLLTNLTEQFEAAAPFNIKIVASQRVWYRTNKDFGETQENVLPAGDNRLYGFSDSINLLFNHSNGVSLYLNGLLLKNLNKSVDPVSISFSAKTSTVTIKHYIPKL